MAPWFTGNISVVESSLLRRRRHSMLKPPRALASRQFSGQDAHQMDYVRVHLHPTMPGAFDQQPARQSVRQSMILRLGHRAQDRLAHPFDVSDVVVLFERVRDLDSRIIGETRLDELV